MCYPSSLRKDAVRLLPSRFEIGPVYTTNPRDRKSLRNASSFKPLAKELCFDIDLTDYDEVRTCCDKANICLKCWQFITMAIKVCDAALRDDFAFKHILWVYSGRRGAHAWVCDKKVRHMDDQKRRAVAGYLEVVRGGAQSGKKVNVRRPLHPHLACVLFGPSNPSCPFSTPNPNPHNTHTYTTWHDGVGVSDVSPRRRSLDILKGHFQQDVLSAQDPWASDEQAEKLLRLLPDRALNDSLRRRWQSTPGRASASKWADIDTIAKSGASRNLDPRALLEAKQDIVLEYTYPRLDIEVSKKLNHLLKSPFVVHPGTGRVCVPIDTGDLASFDPLSVPTVQSLLGEIDAWKPAADDGKAQNVADWEKTSLKSYVEYFRSFVRGLIRDEMGAGLDRDDEHQSMEF